MLHNTYYYSMQLYQPFFGYYFMNALLMVLQLLHIFWSCLIIHMVYRFILCGTVRSHPLHPPSRGLGRSVVRPPWTVSILVESQGSCSSPCSAGARHRQSWPQR